MAEVGGDARGGHGKQKGKKKKKRRLGIRLDMTPMVDVAFLLLTFFIMTTTMSRPQTMEINLPPDSKTTVEVAQSNLLNLLVREDGSIYWNIGDSKLNPPEKVEFQGLRAMLEEKNQSNPKLITLVKIDRKGKYSMMVDIMDELNLANIQRFSLAPMLETDKEILEKIVASL